MTLIHAFRNNIIKPEFFQTKSDLRFFEGKNMNDRNKFQDGFNPNRKSKLTKAVDDTSRKVLASFDDSKIERSHTFTDCLENYSGNSYGSYIVSSFAFIDILRFQKTHIK
jgi:uncharacterized protein YajQ (UPF0234 family)